MYLKKCYTFYTSRGRGHIRLHILKGGESNMDILQLALVVVFTFICGVICTLALQFYLFKRYLESGPQVASPQRQLQHGKAQLPKELVEQLQEERTNCNNSISRQAMSQGNENLAINLTLQFLFNELRNAERVRLWLYRKLNNEFKELLTQSTTAKLLDSVKVRFSICNIEIHV